MDDSSVGAPKARIEGCFRFFLQPLSGRESHHETVIPWRVFEAVERRSWPFLHTAVTAGNGQYAPVGKGRALRVRALALGAPIRSAGTRLQRAQFLRLTPRRRPAGSPPRSPRTRARCLTGRSRCASAPIRVDTNTNFERGSTYSLRGPKTMTSTRFARPPTCQAGTVPGAHSKSV